MPVAVIAVVAIAGEVAMGVALSTIAVGMAVGAVVGGITAAITGGNILKGAFTGGLMGGALAGAGALAAPGNAGMSATGAGGWASNADVAAQAASGVAAPAEGNLVAAPGAVDSPSLLPDAGGGGPGANAVGSAEEGITQQAINPATTSTPGTVTQTAATPQITSTSPTGAIVPKSDSGLLSTAGDWMEKNSTKAVMAGQAISGMATAMLSPDQEQMAKDAAERTRISNVNTFAAPTGSTSGAFNMSYRPTTAPYTQAPSYAKA